MKIYTRQGDGGRTQLRGGQQVAKSDARVAVCGDLDELNAWLGLAAAGQVPEATGRQLLAVQGELLELGAWIAALGPDRDPGDLDLTGGTRRLEQAIDAMERDLTALRQFVLPGGSATAAQLHVGRAICRRAERGLVEAVAGLPGGSAASALAYVNRLSDWLFVAARHANHVAGVPDVPWRGRADNR